MIEPDKPRLKSRIRWREFRLRYNDVVMYSKEVTAILNNFAVYLYNKEIQRANAVRNVTVSQDSEQAIA